MITKLTVRAFKGLREFSIEPRRVNLLIGANGTGKTNFADLIAFMAGVCRRGLVETIEDFGGLSQVRTRRPGKGRPYKFEIELELGEDLSNGIQKAYYSFALAQSNDIKVQNESLDAVFYDFSDDEEIFPRNFDYDKIVDLKYHRSGNNVEGRGEVSGNRIYKVGDEKELLISSFLYSDRLNDINNYIGSWQVYNIDAMNARRSSIGYEGNLRRDGSNTISFVAQMLRDATQRARLLKDLQEVVPYIEDVRPDRLLSLQTLRFLERDTGTEFQLPEVSDGTIRLLGLLAVLRQRVPPRVIVIEEPENALHAYAIHYILKVARQVAMSDRYPVQIFLTTHSPTVVDEVLSLEAMRETDNQTACFITQRKPGEPSIVPAPEAVMQAIARNLGRPSDFQREGSFGDDPVQPALSGVEK